MTRHILGALWTLGIVPVYVGGVHKLGWVQ
jgi:hypothetical protein